MLIFFGSPANVLDYAMEYTRITALGFPVFLLSTGGGHLIRADGRPKMTMICNITGAVVNTILDALFVFELEWGMTGAALATIIGQTSAAAMAVWCFLHCKTAALGKRHLRIRMKYLTKDAALGTATCANQIAMMVVQIIMNKSLKYYGAKSSFGESVPIACVGIISKVNMVYMAFIIGLSQGLQPIASFNYGAGNHQRVKQACTKTLTIGALISVVAFCMFQLFPRQIIAIFGDGSEQYYQFATGYFRIFLFFTFVNFLQPIGSNFFTAIGAPKKGAFLSLTRQIIFLVPLLLLLPLFMGMDGIMYAGPVADGMAALVGGVMLLREFRKEKYRK
jgi:Na+-driven multidrug efflux pump